MANPKKNALNGRITIWFLDEAGATPTPLVHATWAPRGETPVLWHNFGPWDKVNMVSLVGFDGRMFFRTKVGKSMTSIDVAAFLRQVLRHIQGEFVVLWDGANQHKGVAISRVARDHPRLRVERLPPYAFEYNPDEGVWTHLKWADLKNFTPHDTPELVREARRGLRNIQRRPTLVQSFFRKSKLPRRHVELLINGSGAR